jgi:O-acetyl-ADP-ribose deacetylase (regulator of RNase III)
MIRFTQGNLLDANVEAVINTVNTVGVMGKGIALMFRERFPENYDAYAQACKRGEVELGRMFVTESIEISGPRWIINFPTKGHWRYPSQIAWIEAGLVDLRRIIREKGIRSVAIPPLGSGNGGLMWSDVRLRIDSALSDLGNVEVLVYEPTSKYQNVTKGKGVERLTPARAMIAEMVWRYGMLGLECSILEAQKLAWVLTRVLAHLRINDPLKLAFQPDRYGPYAPALGHLLNALDGSYLHCEKRIADASPLETMYFDPEWRERLSNYLKSSDGAPYIEVIDAADRLIDGFQSPLGMEALATVDWLLAKEGVNADLAAVRDGIRRWPAGPNAAKRKNQVFSDGLLESTLDRLAWFSASRS